MQQADNMTYDDMKEVTEGFVCRACEPQCTPNRPGVFTPINLSMSELHVTDNERVHWIDYITEHTEAYDLPALQVAYKKALEGATWSTQLHVPEKKFYHVPGICFIMLLEYVLSRS
jgi:hypothetical protein